MGGKTIAGEGYCHSCWRSCSLYQVKYVSSNGSYDVTIFSASYSYSHDLTVVPFLNKGLQAKSRGERGQRRKLVLRTLSVI